MDRKWPHTVPVCWMKRTGWSCWSHCCQNYGAWLAAPPACRLPFLLPSGLRGLSPPFPLNWTLSLLFFARPLSRPVTFSPFSHRACQQLRPPWPSEQCISRGSSPPFSWCGFSEASRDFTESHVGGNFEMKCYRFFLKKTYSGKIKWC